MYAIETAKLSTKGQLVVPDAFRKHYGWKAGMTLLLIGTADSVVIQQLSIPSDSKISQTVDESRHALVSTQKKLAAAKRSLAKLAKLNIRMPIGIEDGDSRRTILMEKHS